MTVHLLGTLPRWTSTRNVPFGDISTWGNRLRSSVHARKRLNHGRADLLVLIFDCFKPRISILQRDLTWRSCISGCHVARVPNGRGPAVRLQPLIAISHCAILVSFRIHHLMVVSVLEQQVCMGLRPCATNFNRDSRQLRMLHP